MHNRDKYPAIWAEKEKAEAALAPLLAERARHTEAMKSIQITINALEAEKSALNDEAMKDAPVIRELSGDIARYAKAMGAVVASGG